MMSPCVWAAENATPSGLPVPRFVSLKSDEVNIRTGPGTRYPIAWVFRRENMPVQIVDEFDHWRKIQDVEGASGWVHKTMLSGDRMAMIQGKTPRILRDAPEAGAAPVLKAEPMVIARMIECRPQWCRLVIAGHKGWLPKNELWGALKDEVFK